MGAVWGEKCFGGCGRLWGRGGCLGVSGDVCCCYGFALYGFGGTGKELKGIS